MHEDLYDRSMEIGRYYHVYNRGVAKSDIFLDSADYQHFLETMSFYLDDSRPSKFSTARKLKDQIPSHLSPPIAPLAIIHSFCLMPNHFHLLLQEIVEGGISRYMRRTLLSYTRYFNTRHKRVGPIFQGFFRFVPVENDEQFLHVTRYIHLNPYVAHLADDASSYPWSSFIAFRDGTASRLCDPTLSLDLAGNAKNYHDFVNDFAGYARDYSFLKHHAID